MQELTQAIDVVKQSTEDIKQNAGEVKTHLAEARNVLNKQSAVIDKQTIDMAATLQKIVAIQSMAAGLVENAGLQIETEKEILLLRLGTELRDLNRLRMEENFVILSNNVNRRLQAISQTAGDERSLNGLPEQHQKTVIAVIEELNVPVQYENWMKTHRKAEVLAPADRYDRIKTVRDQIVTQLESFRVTKYDLLTLRIEIDNLRHRLDMFMYLNKDLIWEQQELLWQKSIATIKQKIEESKKLPQPQPQSQKKLGELRGL
jgi:hypothetical protein